MADGAGDLKAWEENPANFDESTIMDLPANIRALAMAETFKKEPPDKQAFMILAMFSSGVKQRDLNEAFAAAIHWAEAENVHPVVAAVNLLRLRDVSPAERVRYVEDPTLLADLHGFLMFSGRSIAPVLEFMERGSADLTDPLAVPAAALRTVFDAQPTAPS
jgi:hypothetical protein